MCGGYRYWCDFTLHVQYSILDYWYSSCDGLVDVVIPTIIIVYLEFLKEKGIMRIFTTNQE